VGLNTVSVALKNSRTTTLNCSSNTEDIILRNVIPVVRVEII